MYYDKVKPLRRVARLREIMEIAAQEAPNTGETAAGVTRNDNNYKNKYSQIAAESCASQHFSCSGIMQASPLQEDSAQDSPTGV